MIRRSFPLAACLLVVLCAACGPTCTTPEWPSGRYSMELVRVFGSFPNPCGVVLDGLAPSARAALDIGSTVDCEFGISNIDLPRGTTELHGSESLVGMTLEGRGGYRMTSGACTGLAEIVMSPTRDRDGTFDAEVFRAFRADDIAACEAELGVTLAAGGTCLDGWDATLTAE